MFGAAREQHGIELRQEIPAGDIDAHVRVGLEADTFGLHLGHTAVDEMLLHLEVRDAVAQQSADAIRLFVYGDVMSGARELLCGGETRGARSDYGDSFPGARFSGLRSDPAFTKGMVDD